METPDHISRIAVFGEPSQQLKELLGQDVFDPEFLKHDQLFDALEFAPHAVIWVCNKDALDFAESLTTVSPVLRRPLLLYGEGEFAPTHDLAWKCDARDVLDANESIERLAWRIQACARLAAASAEAAQVKDGNHKARQICVYGAKGGVGTTTIATNMAATYAAQGLQTLLIDLDLQFGDAAMACNVVPCQKMLSFLTQRGSELDTDKVRGCALEVAQSPGLSILPAPLGPEDAGLLDGERLRMLLDSAQHSWDVIVLDLPSHLDEPSFVAMDSADEIVMVSSAHAASIKSTVGAMRALETLNFNARFTCVLNRVSSRKAAKFVKTEVYGVSQWLPDDETVDISVENGNLAALKRGEFSDALWTLASHLVQGTAKEFSTQRKRRGFWTRRREGMVLQAPAASCTAADIEGLRLIMGGASGAGPDASTNSSSGGAVTSVMARESSSQAA